MFEPSANSETSVRGTAVQGQPATIPLSPAGLAPEPHTQRSPDNFEEPSNRSVDEEAEAKFDPAQDNWGDSLADNAEFPGGTENIAPEERTSDQSKPPFISFEQLKRNFPKSRLEVRLAEATPFNDALRRIDQNCNAVAADFALRELRRKLSFHLEYDITSWGNVDPDLLISINSELGEANIAPGADLGEFIALIQRCGLIVRQEP